MVLSYKQSCGADHPTPFSTEIKEIVELHLCTTSGPSWHGCQVNFTLLYFSYNGY
jgi:hypothetical protein